jgi:opacity protein-like surface antigen
MKKIILIIALCSWFLAPAATAQVQPGDTTYSVSLHAGYGHNLTYGSFANFDIDVYMPINPYFEMQANVRTSTANFYTIGVQLRPKFALQKGELYIEDRLMARFIARDQVDELLHAISIGYRMQYIDVQLGVINRVIMPLPYERNTLDKYIVEPFQLLYRVEGFVRPLTSPWNIAIAISNADNYMIERPWVPMLYLGGWYDIDEHWRIRLSGKYKNAGMFHMDAHYYAAEVRVGAEYRF